MDDFATIARTLQDECRRLGLVVPAFRSAPERFIRRYRSGNVVIMVPRSNEMARDCIDGIIAANNLEGGAAETTRRALWQSQGVMP